MIVYKEIIRLYMFCTTVKPVYNDHLGDKDSAVIIKRWLL